MYIASLTYEQFMMLGDAELSRRFYMQDEAEQKARIDRQMSLSMSMNRRSLMLLTVPTLLMEVLVVSL